MSKNRLLFIIIYLLLSILVLQDGLYYSVPFVILNMVLITICTLSLFSQNNISYSLYKIFHLFVLSFFCIAPLIQFKEGVRFFDTNFQESDYIYTTSYIVLIVLLFNCSYKFFYRYSKKSIEKENNFLIKKLNTKKEIIYILVSTSVCLYFLYVNNFSLTSLFFRGGELVDRKTMGQSTDLIMTTFLRPMVVTIFLSAYLLKVKHKIVLYLLFFMLILAAPPTGMARVNAAAMYLPVVMCLFPFLQKKNNFVLLVIVGLLFIFPFLNMFRYLNDNELREINFSLNQFKELHFDSYSMFMRVLREDVVTYGYQLLGVCLFFVPRSMWPDKPIGSGAMIAEETGLPFTNLSMPFFGEGFINFGFVGIVFFTIILSFLTAKIDKRYWTCIVYNKTNVDHILYLILLGLLVFILRGDLMSSFSYTCGYMFSFIFVKKIIVK